MLFRSTKVIIFMWAFGIISHIASIIFILSINEGTISLYTATLILIGISLMEYFLTITLIMFTTYIAWQQKPLTDTIGEFIRRMKFLIKIITPIADAVEEKIVTPFMDKEKRLEYYNNKIEEYKFQIELIEKGDKKEAKEWQKRVKELKFKQRE